MLAYFVLLRIRPYYTGATKTELVVVGATVTAMAFSTWTYTGLSHVLPNQLLLWVYSGPSVAIAALIAILSLEPGAITRALRQSFLRLFRGDQLRFIHDPPYRFKIYRHPRDCDSTEHLH